MSETLPARVFAVRSPVIGMIHLPPLPGSARHALPMARVVERALRDADALVEGGVHGLMIENFGDVPFYPGRVPAETVAAITLAAAEVRRRLPEVPLGINVLRNDGCSALAIAATVGAQFVRVNVLCAARVTDQGIIQGIAHDLLRDRARLNAPDVRILADVDVKHSAPLAARPIEAEVEDTLVRGLANGLIVSGEGTGKPTDLEQVKRVKAAAGDTRLFIGSGVTPEAVASLLPYADGFIVGSAFKADGKPENPVDVDRVKLLMWAIHSANAENPS